MAKMLRLIHGPVSICEVKRISIPALFWTTPLCLSLYSLIFGPTWPLKRIFFFLNA